MEDEVAVVRWDRLMPRMSLRVLLVESDESTRQLITALLKKCSYKVAAVGDGLKAWEFLKKNPQNIDLILTEVDLPSISGYALLTLIMEHGSCSNTPVIMMSSQDSVSTVYKCMLKGASDFLVKPVRINELRNLWQHVWRRQALGKNGPQDVSLTLQKEEATDENNNVGTPSSGFVVCVQTNKECTAKGSDAQSSCAKTDTEVEMVHEDHHPEINTNMWKEEECVKSSPLKHCRKNSGLVVDHGEATITEDTEAVVCNKDNAFVKTSGKAIDFIGSFNDHFDGTSRKSGVANNTKFYSSPMLDLSLRRSHPRRPLNQVSEDRQTLNHSDVSAFSRYISKVPQPLPSPTTICNQQRDFGTNSEKQFSEQIFNYNSYTYSSSLSSQNNLPSSANGLASPSLQQKVISIPVPRSFHQVYKSTDQNFDTSAKQADNYDGRKIDSLNYKLHNSSATDQSASGSLCNINVVHHNSMGCGNNGCADKTSVGGSVGESRNEGSSVFNINYERNAQREAALQKFRLKRKERCFDKKVRYESRKKLAEKRPRVKGQFVRQTPAFVETDS